MSSLVTCLAALKAFSVASLLPRCQLNTVLSGASVWIAVLALAALAVSTTAGSTP
jgi:hypothetical protein